MQLNPEGMQRFQQHLQGVLRNPCAICGAGNWQFDDTIFELRQFTGGGISASGVIKPVVTITCNGCGNVVFLNALTTGIVQVATHATNMPEPQQLPKQENLTEEEAAKIDEAV